MRILKVTAMPQGMGPAAFGLLWIEDDGRREPCLCGSDPSRWLDRDEAAAPDSRRAFLHACERAAWLERHEGAILEPGAIPCATA